MSKRYKGKNCTYCGGEGIADTADHVIARELLPVHHRSNLPKVPACLPCNQAKAKLEHYLSAVLPFGGRHAASPAILAAEVPRRLARNARLHRELASGTQEGWASEQGVMRPTMTIPIDGTKLDALLVYLCRGLAFHHFGVCIPQSYFIGAGALAAVAEPFLLGLLKLNGQSRAEVSLGEGLVEYLGVQAVDDPCLTVWRFRLYGGVVLGDAASSGERPSTLWATSSRRMEQSVFSLG